MAQLQRKLGLPPLEKPLHSEEIKALLRIRYGSLLEFERAKGLAFRSVSQVLGGRSIRGAAEAIADELGIPLHRVSLHYYRLATTVGHRAKAKAAHSLNAEAA